jgi:hypothetical protein
MSCAFVGAAGDKNAGLIRTVVVGLAELVYEKAGMAKVDAKDDVALFLKRLTHSRKDEIEIIRSIILKADEHLTERVKWNAPSFCFRGDDRITFRLQPGDRVQLIFHRGAKVRGDAAAFVFEDMTGLIKWAASDRGVVTFTSMSEVERGGQKLRKLVRAWLKATS